MLPGLRALATALLVASPAYGQIQIPPELPRESTSDIAFEVVSLKVDPARSRSEAGPPTLTMHPSGRFYGSIFTAVRGQLGLKLESTKSHVEMRVIERLERPSKH